VRSLSGKGGMDLFQRANARVNKEGGQEVDSKEKLSPSGEGRVV